MGNFYSHGLKKTFVLILSLGALTALLGFLYVSKFRPHSFVRIDINNDGILEEGYIKNGRAYIGDFVSDAGLKVVQIVGGDFDSDGVNDFGLSLWKRGNYGKAMPFWVKENDDSYKMHLFLYTWRNGKVQALWHSSNLPKKNLDLKWEDADGDGGNELITRERDYFELFNPSTWFSTTTGIWKWNGWGFELESRK